MAAPQSLPGVDPFIPEVWASAIMEPYEKNLVYAQPLVTSSEYLGEITQKGDTVHVGQVGTPTIKAYDESQDLVVEDLTVTDNTLAIDQGDYFAFRVGDVSALQAAGPLKDPATRQAATGLRDKADTYMGNIFKTQAGTKLGAIEVDPASKSDAWTVLLNLRKALNAKSVPTADRYVIVGPEFESALLLDDRFTRADATSVTDGLRNGLIGRAAGFDVLVSNNAPLTAGREVQVAGVRDAATFVSQINKVETAREERRFADIVKGLLIYGGKVFRPEGVVTAEVTLATPVEEPAA